MLIKDMSKQTKINMAPKNNDKKLFHFVILFQLEL